MSDEKCGSLWTNSDPPISLTEHAIPLAGEPRCLIGYRLGWSALLALAPLRSQILLVLDASARFRPAHRVFHRHLRRVSCRNPHGPENPCFRVERPMRISAYMVSLTWRSVGDQLDIDMVVHVSALTTNSGGLRQTETFPSSIHSLSLAAAG